MNCPNFSTFFNAIWNRDPFPWQRMLAERLVKDSWPQVLDLPTAAGKTACIDIAIHSLAAQADKPFWERIAPRRIWFVVDRRIVVDEAFERAREIAEQLQDAKGGPLKEIADRLRKISGTERPLAVARLRGGVLRDDRWALLPSQPAVITSTVDQLGSRLLFRGYGRSALTAPIFAGLAAHDSLILLDEAHLSVPFLQTLRALHRFRGERWAEQPIKTPFAFSMLSATPPPDISPMAVFPGVQWDEAMDHPELKSRMNASKPAKLISIKAKRSSDQDVLVQEATKWASHYLQEEEKQRVAVIVNRVRTAESTAGTLGEMLKDQADVVLLTGRLRPFERDQLVSRWKPVLKANHPENPRRPIVLVTTQCIEVGADFSFDALVTEVASLDALRQRFGRLNRLGRAETSSAVVLAREEEIKEGYEDFVYGEALANCWKLLYELAESVKEEGPIVDFGIAKLSERLQGIDDLAVYLAPSPNAPLLLPSHLDLLCQTAPRPQVEPDIQLYLHGVGRGSAEVSVVWRADLTEDRTDIWPETISLCPPNSTEMMTIPLYRLRQWLANASGIDKSSDVEGSRNSEQTVNGRTRPVLIWQGRDRSGVCHDVDKIKPNDVIVLPAGYGMVGLGQSEPSQALGAAKLDIWEPSHAQSGKQIAFRLNREVLRPWLDCGPLRKLVELAEDPGWDRDTVIEAIEEVLIYKPAGEGTDTKIPPEWLTDLLRKISNGRIEEHPSGGLILYSRTPQQENSEQDFFADDDDLLSATGQEVGLKNHSASVERAVEKMASLCLPDEFKEPLKVAAYWHDIGKLDERFQIMLRQGDELAALTDEPLAKSKRIPESPARRRAIRMASGLPERFRHEMLSLQLAEHYLATGNGDLHEDLLLHAIASHHGHGRPFAPVCIDPEPPSLDGVHDGVPIKLTPFERVSSIPTHSLASGISERFWRLTRRYGWWGLAYLEAILRLADWYGSWKVIPAAPDKTSPRYSPAASKIVTMKQKPLILTGIDGANPLGYLAALGTLVVCHQAGYPQAQMAWQREGPIWHPWLAGVPTTDLGEFADWISKNLMGKNISREAEKAREESENQVDEKSKKIKKQRESIKKRGLKGREREQAIQEEIAPLVHDLDDLRKIWLENLRKSVPRTELALGKNIDCTAEEYRSIVEPLSINATLEDRYSMELLASFCSDGCFHDNADKRKEGKLASSLFSFISGSGHQNFLETAGELLKYVSSERVKTTLFQPWIYEDEKLAFRWDPAEDRRYALMDRDPTATDNKPRTVWMANLLAYRALALFPSAPTPYRLATVGWMSRNDDAPCFTWPLWQYSIGPDSIRSLMLLPELYASKLEPQARMVLGARGVQAVFRSQRIKVGSGSNYKINFSPARQI